PCDIITEDLDLLFVKRIDSKKQLGAVEEICRQAMTCALYYSQELKFRQYLAKKSGLDIPDQLSTKNIRFVLMFLVNQSGFGISNLSINCKSVLFGCFDRVYKENSIPLFVRFQPAY